MEEGYRNASYANFRRWNYWTKLVEIHLTMQVILEIFCQVLRPDPA
jgi:hypothetical protein